MNEKPEALRLADECEESAKAWANEVTTRQQAAAQLRSLHTENEALRKDAERYRWLRDEAYGYFWVNHGGCYPRRGLDVAIDAAMKGQP